MWWIDYKIILDSQNLHQLLHFESSGPSNLEMVDYMEAFWRT